MYVVTFNRVDIALSDKSDRQKNNRGIRRG